MNKCIYKGIEFEQASEEHILQNSLGARWTDNSIVCNEVQQYFGNTIDTEIEKGLRPIRTLLGVKGGRGGEAPPIKQAKTESGSKFHIEAGGKPLIAAPIISTRKLDDSHEIINIQVADIKQLGWAIHELKKRYPHDQFNEEEIYQAATPSQSYLDEPVQIDLSFGGKDFYRGICKSAFNLLGATKSEVVHHRALNSIRNFILNGDGNINEFIGWVPYEDRIELPSIAYSDHFIGIYILQGQIEGIVQLYGELPFIIHFGEQFDCEDSVVAYVVNPFRDTDPAESRSLHFDPDKIPSYSSCRHIFDLGVQLSYISRIYRVLSTNEDRVRKATIQSIVEDVLGGREGEPITADDIAVIAERCTQFYMR